jgi:NLI interacting factor-like phosphatase
LKHFLHYAFDKFETVSIWTAASKDWANTVYNNILKPNIPVNKNFTFIWDGKKCTQKSNRNAIMEGDFYARSVTIKRLKKVWNQFKSMNKDNTLILDDTPNTYKENFGNVIPIATFIDNENDDYLLKLTTYSDSLIQLESIRTVEKRNWYIKKIE